MGKFAAFFMALRYGSSLTDPALWKQRQNTINAVVGLLGAAVVFFPVEVSHEDLELIAGGIAVVLGLFNTYLTTATTTKIGSRTHVRSDGSDQGPRLDDPGP